MAKNEIAVVDLDQLPSTQVGGDDLYSDLAQGTQFLGRLQLFTKGSAIDLGLIKPGHYGIPESGDNVVALSESIDVLVLARRPKALDMTDKEALIVNYDPNSDEFKRVAAQSAEKESHCMYGPSFLVYERSSGRFLEYFCGSKSSRAEAKNIYPYLPLTATDIKARGLTDVEPHGPLPMTLKSKYVKKGSYSWHVPVVVKCSLPFSKLPAMDKIVAEITKFVNPKADGSEKVPEPETKGKKRVR